MGNTEGGMDDHSEEITMQGAVCPVPLQHSAQVVLGHGSGGKLTQDLIERSFYPPFENPTLLRGNDSAVVTAPEGGRLAITALLRRALMEEATRHPAGSPSRRRTTLGRSARRACCRFESEVPRRATAGMPS